MTGSRLRGSGRAGARRAARPKSDPGYRPLLVLQLQTELAELLADLVERGDAEVLALHQLVAGVDDQLADGLDSELGHALAGADGEVEVADRLGQKRLLFLGKLLDRLVDRAAGGAALAAFEGHPQAEALRGHHL